MATVCGDSVADHLNLGQERAISRRKAASSSLSLIALADIIRKPVAVS
jgi:hypothetical protein